MEGRPPVWLIAVLGLQAALAAALLAFGASLTGSLSGSGRVSYSDIAALSFPLLSVIALGGLSWWLWMSGRRTAGGCAVFLPVVASLLFLFLFGMVI